MSDIVFQFCYFGTHFGRSNSSANLQLFSSNGEFCVCLFYLGNYNTMCNCKFQRNPETCDYV